MTRTALEVDTHVATRPCLGEVLSGDPEHPAARKLRGQVKVGGKWLTPEQARAAGYKEQNRQKRKRSRRSSFH